MVALQPLARSHQWHGRLNIHINAYSEESTDVTQPRSPGIDDVVQDAQRKCGSQQQKTTRSEIASVAAFANHSRE